MNNFWLDRRPQVYQQLNPYADCYGKYYVLRGTDYESFEYLHRDGTWRSTPFNLTVGKYSGYYDTLEEAVETLDLFRHIE